MQFYQVHGGGGFGGATAPGLTSGPQAAVASLASAASPFGLQALAAAAGVASSDWAVPAAPLVLSTPNDAPSAAAAAEPPADAAAPAAARSPIDSAPLAPDARLKPPTALVAAIVHKAAAIAQANSPEETSGKTREIIERQMSILEQERDRLTPIASREHWIALVFAVLAGSVLLSTIALAIFASGQQALITLVSSVLPGFLTAVFFHRETNVENRIAAIASDLRQSERFRDRLAILQELLPNVPPESRIKVVDSFTGMIT